MATTEPAPAQTRLARALGASRRSEIDSFIVMDVMRAAAEAEARGVRVVHMEVGQPGTGAPRAALEAVREAIGREPLGYTLALGNEALRRRIAQQYLAWYGVEIDPSRVIITTGSSAGFVLAFLALFDAGDRVGLPSPGYPCYRHILSALGQTPVILPTDETTRWMPGLEQVDAAVSRHGLAGLLVASPNNPTGTVLEPDRLEGLIEVCAQRGCWYISDEIYHGLTYDRPAATALQFSDDAIVINSFSKYYSMTGWRVGWLVVPDRLVRSIEKLAQNLYIAPPAVSQVAALGAFDGADELERNKATYAQNRQLLLRELPRLGFDRIVPADGAFYLYVDISRFSDDSLAFARRVLDETGIAVTPGLDFDAERGKRFLRLSYSTAPEAVADAVARLERWPVLGSK